MPKRGITAAFAGVAGVILMSTAISSAEQHSLTPGQTERGVASYYGEKFRNKRTASGEKFNPNGLTAAHPSLPLGTKVEVENLKTGEEVEVRVNDRGPYIPGRDIDVSKKAAEEIGLTKPGTAPVEIKVVEPPKHEPKAGSPKKEN